MITKIVKQDFTMENQLKLVGKCWKGSFIVKVAEELEERLNGAWEEQGGYGYYSRGNSSGNESVGRNGYSSNW
jgi:hypothetical protein